MNFSPNYGTVSGAVTLSVEQLFSQSGTLASRWFVRQVIKDAPHIIKSLETSQCIDDDPCASSSAALYTESCDLPDGYNKYESRL